MGISSKSSLLPKPHCGKWRSVASWMFAPLDGSLHQPGIPAPDDQTFTFGRRRTTGHMAAAARMGLLMSKTEALPSLSPVVIVGVL